MKKFYSLLAIASVSLFSGSQAFADSSSIEVPSPTFPSDCRSVSPENGATVTELTQISFTYKDNFGSTTLESISVDQSKNFTIDGVTYARGSYTYSQSGFTTTITLNEPITSEGLHEIDIPKGFFMLGGDYVEQMGYGKTAIGQIKWYVIVEPEEGGGDGPDQPDPDQPDPDQPSVPETSIPSYFTVSPADGATLKELSEITVNYITTSTRDEFYGYATIYNFTINGEAYSGKTGGNCKGKLTPDQFGYVITLNEPITTPGVYTIIFPKGYFEYDDMELDGLTWSVTVDVENAVETVGAEAAVKEIFTMEGLRVNEMQPGKIYIVRNGDKVTKVLSR